MAEMEVVSAEISVVIEIHDLGNTRVVETKKVPAERAPSLFVKICEGSLGGSIMWA